MINVFIFGGSGFVGRNLIAALDKRIYRISGLVRTEEEAEFLKKLGAEPVIGDVLDLNSFLAGIAEDSIIFYLIHGLGRQKKKAELLEIEERAVNSLIEAARIKKARQIIHLTGIYFEEQKLSPHLSARKLTLEKIRDSGLPYAIIRTSVIFGRGSISFEIIKALLAKIPLIPLFSWRKSKISPIHIQDIVFALTHIIENPAFLNKIIDIGGPRIFSYGELFLEMARFRGQKRFFLKLPLNLFFLPALISALLTGFSFREVYFLFQSLKDDVFAPAENFQKFFGQNPKSIFDKTIF
ncbi:MAG: NAD(P)H-binding protein [Candidatus Nealsonbacteria bacterium]|nr:NAD(P)H-binding protein [Candidatus Nealsonbacteria bacterium]